MAVGTYKSTKQQIGDLLVNELKVLFITGAIVGMGKKKQKNKIIAHIFH